MFDISFGEIMLIGVIALVVIGPQKLPTVARTIGHLLGRAQRYVNNVKGDIQREMDLEEFNRLKQQMDDASRTVNSSLRETADSLRDPLAQAQRAFDDMAAETTQRADAPATGNTLPDDFDPFNTPEPAPADPPARSSAAAADTPAPASPAPAVDAARDDATPPRTGQST